jgi:hypothetical protein
MIREMTRSGERAFDIPRAPLCLSIKCEKGGKKIDLTEKIDVKNTTAQNRQLTIYETRIARVSTKSC